VKDPTHNRLQIHPELASSVAEELTEERIGHVLESRTPAPAGVRLASQRWGEASMTLPKMSMPASKKDPA
jgi:hypothetical protein